MDEPRPVGRRRFLAESLAIGGVIAASAAWAYVHKGSPPVPKESDSRRSPGLVARPRDAGEASPGPSASASPRPRPPREGDHLKTQGTVFEGGPPEPDILTRPNGK